MIALISAGGLGTRLKEITSEKLPKPMAKIAGKPIILRAVETLKENGVDEFYFSVGHLAGVIKDYFGSGEKFGVKINYIEEKTPLGSGGALYYLKGKVSGDFIVCSGDTVFDINVKKMLSFHKRKKAVATLFTHPNLHPYDSDVIVADKFGRVKEIDLKTNVRNYYYNNNVNAGFFIINSAALGFFDREKKVNMEHDFINALIRSGERVYSYKSPEYIKDVGTPERFYAVEKDILNGLVAARNLKYKQKAVFLDRDGTLNVYKGFIKNAEDIELSFGAAEAVKKINKSGYLAIVVSNQPVIARGEASFEEVERCFSKIETLLGREGAYLDGVFYCPHHPHKGFKGEVKRLKKDCDCRKPKIGLLLKAQKQFNLDLKKCCIIGDSDADVITGLNAGIVSVKIKSDLKEEEKATPSFYAEDLVSAVDLVIKG